MNNLVPKHRSLVLLFALLLLASCAAPHVKEARRPILDSPLMAALVNPNKLTLETRAHLEEQNLLGVYNFHEMKGTDGIHRLVLPGANKR